MTKRVFGHIEGFPVGSWFESRSALSQAGVHRPTQAGIAGSEREGADSIVLSGGYEDDVDWGDEIIYTGQGGRNPVSGRQVEHQHLNRGNLALAKSKLHRLPVRVIRGSTHKSRYSPETGYRYDGLFLVEDYWQERGKSGYYVWRFRLVKYSGDETLAESQVREEQSSYSVPECRETMILRIVRDTEQARRIKKLYDFRCQVCGTRLEGSAGPYAEAAHIRPLGAPHNGTDSLDNLLCLCPNHHVLFDYHAFSIAEDFSLIGIDGYLIRHARHRINPENLRYHREHYYPDMDHV